MTIPSAAPALPPSRSCGPERYEILHEIPPESREARFWRWFRDNEDRSLCRHAELGGVVDRLVASCDADATLRVARNSRRVVKIRLLAFVLVCITAVPCAAQRPWSAGCKGDTQLALSECAAARNADAEATLSRRYQAMLRTASGASLQLFRRSQQEWLKYRETHCQWIASQFEGGTFQPLYYSLCLERVARARIRQLRADTADLGFDRGEFPQ